MVNPASPAPSLQGAPVGPNDVSHSVEWFEADEGPEAPDAMPAAVPSASSSTQRTLHRAANLIFNATGPAATVAGQTLGNVTAGSLGVGPIGTIVSEGIGSTIREAFGTAVAPTQTASSSSSSSTQPAQGPSGSSSSSSASSSAAAASGVSSGLSARIAEGICFEMRSALGASGDAPCSSSTSSTKFYPFATGYALVTRSVSGNSEEGRSERAEKAIAKTWEVVYRKKVLGIQNPIEWDDAKKLYPDCPQVPMNPVLAVKHHEMDISFQVMKARFVAGGDRLKGADGRSLSGRDEDASVLPTQLGGFRLIVSYAASIGGIALTADVEEAYLTSPLLGPPTFGRLARRIRPAGWASHMKDPVVRVLQALPGMPRAGDNWDTYFSWVCVEVGMEEFHDCEGTLWVKRHAKKPVTLLGTYADDLCAGRDPVEVQKLLTALEAYLVLKRNMNRAFMLGSIMSSLMSTSV